MPFDTMPGEVTPAPQEELAIVERMIALLRNPMNWTQGALKRSRSPAHDAYCLIGALSHVATGDFRSISAGCECPRTMWRVLNVLDIAVNRGLVNYNDDKDRTHTEVMALLTKVRSQFQ